MTNKELAARIKQSRTHNEYLVNFFDWAERITDFINSYTRQPGFGGGGGSKEQHQVHTFLKEYKELTQEAEE